MIAGVMIRRESADRVLEDNSSGHVSLGSKLFYGVGLLFFNFF